MFVVVAPNEGYFCCVKETLHMLKAQMNISYSKTDAETVCYG